MSRLDDAMQAIQAELGPERPLSAIPADIREMVVGFVADGLCTGAQAAEALALSVELANAKERGEICDAQGIEIMARLGLRHRDGGGEA
jgi:hypothetical protein